MLRYSALRRDTCLGHFFPINKFPVNAFSDPVGIHQGTHNRYSPGPFIFSGLDTSPEKMLVSEEPPKGELREDSIPSPFGDSQPKIPSKKRGSDGERGAPKGVLREDSNTTPFRGFSTKNPLKKEGIGW